MKLPFGGSATIAKILVTTSSIIFFYRVIILSEQFSGLKALTAEDGQQKTAKDEREPNIMFIKKKGKKKKEKNCSGNIVHPEQQHTH